MQRGDAGEADTCVCSGDVVDEVCRAGEVPNTPASTVEVLSCGANRESPSGDFRGEGGDAGERGVREAVVDFVGEDEDVVFYAEVADGLEFGFGKDFADGVMAGPFFQLVLENEKGRGQTYGVLMTIIFVFGLMAFSTSAILIVQSAAEDISLPPFLGG